MIKIFFDTNIIQGELHNRYRSLKDFSLSRNLDKVYDLVKSLQISDITRLYLPSTVLSEIRQHRIEKYQENLTKFTNELNIYKEIFGTNLKINRNPIDRIENFIIELDKAIQEFLESKKDFLTIVELKSLLCDIAKKAVNKEMMFVSAKGNSKEYSDAGFKDHLILETILQEIGDRDNIILYSKDSDFDEACKRYNFKRLFDLEALKSFIINQSPEARERYIIRKMSSPDNKMKIAGYCESNGKNYLANKDFMLHSITKESATIDECENNLIVNLKIKSDEQIYLVNVRLDLLDYDVMDASIVRRINE